MSTEAGSSRRITLRCDPGRKPFRIATGILFVLVLLPWTGFVVRPQTSGLFFPAFGVKYMLRNCGIKDVPLELPADSFDGSSILSEAAAHPVDYTLQVAATQFASEREVAPSHRVAGQRLEALLERFPRSPALVALILRYYSYPIVDLNRPEIALLDGDGYWYERPPSDPRDVAKFVGFARRGESIDPGNAFFSMMLAAGLFQQHQDVAALAAIHRAAQKNRWDDGVGEAQRCAVSGLEQSYGTQPLITRMMIAESIPMTHFTLLRASSRLAAWCAICLEKTPSPVGAGIYRGLEIRHDLVCCGRLMRVQSQSAFGQTMGAFIASVAATRPGGIPPMKSSYRFGWQRALFCAYLIRHGQPEEADRNFSEWKAGDELRAAGYRLAPFNLPAVRHGLWWWLASSACLGCGLLVLLLSAASRLPWKRQWDAAAVSLIAAVLAGATVFAAFYPCAGSVLVAMSAFYDSWAPTYFPYGMGIVIRVFSTLALTFLPWMFFLGVLAAASLQRRPTATTVLQWWRAIGPAIACSLLLLYTVLLIPTIAADQQQRARFDVHFPSGNSTSSPP